MFTGIVEASTCVTRLTKMDAGALVTIRRPQNWSVLRKGVSIAVDGVCLTVSRFTRSTIQFDCAPQTLKRTRLGSIRVGEMVNLERPLRMGAELGGHWVTGHVDGVGVVKSVNAQSGHWLTVRIPRLLTRFCPARGSIAINGVSLTIAQRRGRLVGVTLIPTTLRQTNLGSLKTGSLVNIEIDIIARYLEKLIQRDT